MHTLSLGLTKTESTNAIQIGWLDKQSCLTVHRTSKLENAVFTILEAYDGHYQAKRF